MANKIYYDGFTGIRYNQCEVTRRYQELTSETEEVLVHTINMLSQMEDYRGTGPNNEIWPDIIPTLQSCIGRLQDLPDRLTTSNLLEKAIRLFKVVNSCISFYKENRDSEHACTFVNGMIRGTAGLDKMAPLLLDSMSELITHKNSSQRRARNLLWQNLKYYDRLYPQMYHHKLYSRIESKIDLVNNYVTLEDFIADKFTDDKKDNAYLRALVLMIMKKHGYSLRLDPTGLFSSGDKAIFNIMPPSDTEVSFSYPLVGTKQGVPLLMSITREVYKFVQNNRVNGVFSKSWVKMDVSLEQWAPHIPGHRLKIPCFISASTMLRYFYTLSDRMPDRPDPLYSKEKYKTRADYSSLSERLGGSMPTKLILNCTGHLSRLLDTRPHSESELKSLIAARNMRAICPGRLLMSMISYGLDMNLIVARHPVGSYNGNVTGVMVVVRSRSTGDSIILNNTRHIVHFFNAHPLEGCRPLDLLSLVSFYAHQIYTENLKYIRNSCYGNFNDGLLPREVPPLKLNENFDEEMQDWACSTAALTD